MWGGCLGCCAQKSHKVMLCRVVQMARRSPQSSLATRILRLGNRPHISSSFELLVTEHNICTACEWPGIARMTIKHSSQWFDKVWRGSTCYRRFWFVRLIIVSSCNLKRMSLSTCCTVTFFSLLYLHLFVPPHSDRELALCSVTATEVFTLVLIYILFADLSNHPHAVEECWLNCTL